jgi:hypothetical protein
MGTPAVNATPNPAWEVFDMEQALNQNFPEPKWLVESLVPEGTVVLVSGLPHVGKTLDWLAAGIEAVARHKVWDHFDASNVHRWLYVETEDPRSRVVQRIRDLCKGLGIDPAGKIPAGFYWARTGPFELTESERQLRTIMEGTKPDVMVLSTLQGLLGARDMKSQADMAPVNAMLVRLAEICPIVLLTHSPLNEKVRRAYGTVMQGANCGVTIHFERLGSGDQSMIHATADEKYERGRWDFTLRLDTEDVLHDGKVSKRPRRVTASDGLPKAFRAIAVLQKIKTDSIPPSVREIAEETGVPKSTVQRIIKGAKNGPDSGTPSDTPKKRVGQRTGHRKTIGAKTHAKRAFSA